MSSQEQKINQKKAPDHNTHNTAQITPTAGSSSGDFVQRSHRAIKEPSSSVGTLSERREQRILRGNRISHTHNRTMQRPDLRMEGR